MKKRIIAILVIVVMIISLILPMLTVFSEDAIEAGALELFLNKLATISDDNREFVALVLELHILTDEGIDELKSAINTLANEDQIEELEDHGYTLRDLKNELARLKDWSISDREKLILYIREGNVDEVEELILKYEEVEDEEPGAGTGGAGGGAIVEIPIEIPSVQDGLLNVGFVDIENHWAMDAIKYLAERGIIKGKTDTSFDPDGKITRAEFTTLIVRLFGLSPENDTALSFKDVSAGQWYYEVIKVAFDNGLINGLDVDNFGPNNSITREQMVAVIMRILEQQELTTKLTSVGRDLSQFIDKENISSWAVDNMAKAIKYGIISGRSNENLAPQDNTTRAEAANIIMKLYLLLNS